MKLYLNIIFLFLTLCIKSQENKIAVIKIAKQKESKSVFVTTNTSIKITDTVITIPLNVLSSYYRISDLIQETISKECEDLNYDISLQIMKSLKIFHEQGNVLSSGTQSIYRHLKPGDKFFIDNIKSPCFNPRKKLYTILIGK